MDKKLTYNLLFAVSWALLTFTIKLSMNSGVIPLGYTFQYMFLTSILLSMYLAVTEREQIRKISLRDVPIFLAVGIFVAAGFIIGGAYGMKLTTSINYSLVTKADIIFLPVMGYFILKEKISARSIPLILALILGLYLLLTSGRPVIPNLGDIYSLIGIFFYSLAAVFQKALVRRLSPAIVGWVRISCALLFIALIVPLLEPAFMEIRSPHLILATAVINVFLAIFINKALSVSSATFYGMAAMTVPVMVAGLGMLFLNETLGPIQFLGAFIILAAGFTAKLWKI